jgi:hypothetical protein
MAWSLWMMTTSSWWKRKQCVERLTTLMGKKKTRKGTVKKKRGMDGQVVVILSGKVNLQIYHQPIVERKGEWMIESL